VEITRKVKVKNAMGLHARPATAIVKMLQASYSSVLFTYRKDTVNARSIMSILMLAAKKNSNITITVNGKDSAHTMDLLVQAFENRFGEI